MLKEPIVDYSMTKERLVNHFHKQLVSLNHTINCLENENKYLRKAIESYGLAIIEIEPDENIENLEDDQLFRLVNEN